MGAARIPPSLDEANTDLPLVALSWFVVWSERGSERAAADALEAKGFSVYLPLETFNRKVRDRLVVSARPLFPRYLFAGCEVHDDWGEMKRTDHVERIMGKLSPKATMQMFRLQRDEAKGEFDLTIDRTPPLEVGQLVSIDLEGREVFGEILTLTPDERVEVLLINFLGKARAIRPKAEVRAA